MGSFTYIVEVGSFSYITEGGVIHIHFVEGGVIHIHFVEGGVIHIHCRGWGHSHTLQSVGSITYIVVLIICTCHSHLHGLYGATIFMCA